MNLIEKYFIAFSERVNSDCDCKQTFTKDFDWPGFEKNTIAK